MEYIRTLSYLGMLVMWIISVINIFKMKEWTTGKKIGYLLATIVFFMIAVIWFFFEVKKKNLAIISIIITVTYLFSVFA